MSVKPRVRRILRPVRRALFIVLALAACRRTHPPVETAPPGAPAAAPVAPAPAPLDASAVVPPAPATEAGEGRVQPPSAAEIRAQLDPLWPALRACVRAQGPVDAAVPLELHVRVEPAGEVSDASIVGLASAHDCTRETMSKLRLPRWRGLATIISITLTSTGDPLRVPIGDGGQ